MATMSPSNTEQASPYIAELAAQDAREDTRTGSGERYDAYLNLLTVGHLSEADWHRYYAAYRAEQHRLHAH